MSSSVLVIGIGNPDRGDDAAGREAAQRLRQKNLTNVRVVETEGEATALLSLLEDAAAVYLIDACVSGAPPGAVRRIDIRKTGLPPARYGVSSHGFGLAEALSLGQTLATLPETCIIYAVEAESFYPGTPLSAAVSAAVDDVVVALCREISGLAEED